MSKEKQCECCHEWWYGSDVKEDLCPNCYDYFKQLKRQLEEKDKEIEKLKQEFEENKLLIKNWGARWWLRSSILSLTLFTYIVLMNGVIHISHCASNTFYARPAFEFKPEIEVEVKK